MVTIWTDEACDLLRTMFKEGRTSGQMSARLAAELNIRVSRNAVVGKLHRLGLTLGLGRNRSMVSKSVRRRQRAVAQRAVARGEAPPPKPQRFGSPDNGGFARGAGTPDPGYPKLVARMAEADNARLTAGKFVPLVELEPCQCSYVFGAPKLQRCCGEPRVPGLPYCEAHARACSGHAPAPRRRKSSNTSPAKALIAAE